MRGIKSGEDVWKQTELVPDRSVVHHVAGQTQHQSGCAFAAAGSVTAPASGAKVDGASRMLIYDVGGGVFDGSLSITKDGILEVRAMPGDDLSHEEDFDSGTRRRAGVQEERADSWKPLSTRTKHILSSSSQP